MGLKESRKGEGDEPRLARLSQPPRACFLGASWVIYGVWLATGCNASKLVASEKIMNTFSLRRKEGAPLHRARAGLFTGQIWQCFGYRCRWTHPLGHMLINHGRMMAKNLKTSPTKHNLCELPPASLLNEYNAFLKSTFPLFSFARKKHANKEENIRDHHWLTRRDLNCQYSFWLAINNMKTCVTWPFLSTSSCSLLNAFFSWKNQFRQVAKLSACYCFN